MSSCSLVEESLVNEDKLLSRQLQQIGNSVQTKLIVPSDAHTLFLFITSASLLQNSEYRESMNMYISLLS